MLIEFDPASPDFLGSERVIFKPGYYPALVARVEEGVIRNNQAFLVVRLEIYEPGTRRKTRAGYWIALQGNRPAPGKWGRGKFRALMTALGITARVVNTEDWIGKPLRVRLVLGRNDRNLVEQVLQATEDDLAEIRARSLNPAEARRVDGGDGNPGRDDCAF